MSDLIAFLKARLDEDEAAARAVESLGYVTDMGGSRLDERFTHGRLRFAPEDGRSRIEPDPSASRHFARHDPARVLREVAAKRAMLAELTRWPFDYREGCNDTIRLFVHLLALPYSDHPEYREEWKP